METKRIRGRNTNMQVCFLENNDVIHYPVQLCLILANLYNNLNTYLQTNEIFPTINLRLKIPTIFE